MKILSSRFDSTSLRLGVGRGRDIVAGCEPLSSLSSISHWPVSCSGRRRIVPADDAIDDRPGYGPGVHLPRLREPALQDALIAGFFLIAMQVEVWAFWVPHEQGPTPFAAVMGVLIVLPLFWRRRAPLGPAQVALPPRAGRRVRTARAV